MSGATANGLIKVVFNTRVQTNITVLLERRRLHENFTGDVEWRRTMGARGFAAERPGRLAVLFLKGFGLADFFLKLGFVGLACRAFFALALAFRMNRLWPFVSRWSVQPPRRIVLSHTSQRLRVLLYAFFLAFRAWVVWLRHRFMCRLSSSPASSM